VSVKMGVRHVCAYIPVQIYEEMLKEKAMKRINKVVNDCDKEG